LCLRQLNKYNIEKLNLVVKLKKKLLSLNNLLILKKNINKRLKKKVFKCYSFIELTEEYHWIIKKLLILNTFKLNSYFKINYYYKKLKIKSICIKMFFFLNKMLHNNFFDLKIINFLKIKFNKIFNIIFSFNINLKLNYIFKQYNKINLKKEKKILKINKKYEYKKKINIPYKNYFFYNNIRDININDIFNDKFLLFYISLKKLKYNLYKKYTLNLFIKKQFLQISYLDLKKNNRIIYLNKLFYYLKKLVNLYLIKFIDINNIKKLKLKLLLKKKLNFFELNYLFIIKKLIFLNNKKSKFSNLNDYFNINIKLKKTINFFKKKKKKRLRNVVLSGLKKIVFPSQRRMFFYNKLNNYHFLNYIKVSSKWKKINKKKYTIVIKNESKIINKILLLNIYFLNLKELKKLVLTIKKLKVFNINLVKKLLKIKKLIIFKFKILKWKRKNKNFVNKNYLSNEKKKNIEDKFYLYNYKNIFFKYFLKNKKKFSDFLYYKKIYSLPSAGQYFKLKNLLNRPLFSLKQKKHKNIIKRKQKKDNIINLKLVNKELKKNKRLKKIKYIKIKTFTNRFGKIKVKKKKKSNSSYFKAKPSVGKIFSFFFTLSRECPKNLDRLYNSFYLYNLSKFLKTQIFLNSDFNLEINKNQNLSIDQQIQKSKRWLMFCGLKKKFYIKLLKSKFFNMLYAKKKYGKVFSFYNINLFNKLSLKNFIYYKSKSLLFFKLKNSKIFTKDNDNKNIYLKKNNKFNLNILINKKKKREKKEFFIPYFLQSLHSNFIFKKRKKKNWVRPKPEWWIDYPKKEYVKGPISGIDINKQIWNRYTEQGANKFWHNFYFSRLYSVIKKRYNYRFNLASGKKFSYVHYLNVIKSRFNPFFIDFKKKDMLLQNRYKLTLDSFLSEIKTPFFFGKIYFQFRHNNIFACLTDMNNELLMFIPGGKLFKGPARATTYAREKTAMHIGERAFLINIKVVDIIMKNKLSRKRHYNVLKGLGDSNMNIRFLITLASFAHGYIRSQKKRRK
jgi:hypothetical protein